MPCAFFDGRVAESFPPARFAARNYLLDAERCDSEGNWAFCRFLSDEIPAVRMGFQRGGFNIGAAERVPDRSLLQLHLELMTREGALLWLPTGGYEAGRVASDGRRLDIRLADAGGEIFAIRGWPRMRWHFRSADGEAEAELEIHPAAVTLLPDCILPHCTFGMWAAMGEARGVVRYRERKIEVRGKAFCDHPRIRHGDNPVPPRRRYLYTTLFFEDGSGLLGYHAQDSGGEPIRCYCFGLHIGPDGRVEFLPQALLHELRFDAHGLPAAWRMSWTGERTRGGHTRLEAEIRVRPATLRRSWGSPSAPRSLEEFIILPLVLDGQVTAHLRDGRRAHQGYGLAEYFDAAAWGGGGDP